ncbi:glycoside hydrolase family 172 protein [Chitinophaga niabensis]|uniref:glycoside hydrolase family 172 protein n=1 Tax=Chitinophaga niabensis TaxID=536979 RepID=UPI0031BB8984
MKWTFLIIMICSCSSLYAQEMTDLSIIQQQVKSKRISSYDRSGDNHDNLQHIKHGEKRVIFDVKGTGIIKHIWMTMGPEPAVLSRNDIIIRMYWDGQEYPSVESPIGPFFGQGWNETYLFTSAPLVAAPMDGMGLVSYFAMPFQKGGKVEIENQSGREINTLYFYIDYVEMKQLPQHAGRFHAWYNKQLTASVDSIENEHWMFGPGKPNKTGKDNYLIANIKGKGHFVGVNYYVHSPTPYWYGEGDDMIFVDDNILYGTGTEDYFNTSWGAPKTPYATPYFGYARVNNDIGFLGRTHIYRFNIADPIHFDSLFRFTIEHGSMNVLTLDLASVAYWYQDKASPVPAIPDAAARKPQPMIGPSDIHRWRNEWRKSKGNNPTLWGN